MTHGNNFDIGIVTFQKRFTDFFVPLIEEIKKYNQNSNILVNVNGNLNKPFDENYRKDFLNFISPKEKIFPFIWTEFRSLSKLWNNCILNSQKEHILILNDDIKILNENLFIDIDTAIKNNNDFFTINQSFSHFVISKKIAIKVGFFDERLLGVGHEDADMINRCGLTTNGGIISNIQTDGVENIISNIVEDYNKVHTKYSKFNEWIFFSDIPRIPPNYLYPTEDWFLKNKHLL